MAGSSDLGAEFTDAATGRLRFSVTLTDSCLSVRKISGSPAWQHGHEHALELGLGDCVGCRASRSEDDADTTACLSAYFYPARRSWTGAPAGRHRVEHRFRVSTGEDARANLEEAERWARAIRHRASQHVQCPRDGEEKFHLKKSYTFLPTIYLFIYLYLFNSEFYSSNVPYSVQYPARDHHIK